MKKILFLCLVGILSGCTTVGAVNKSYSKVNATDGIDEKEAVAIAQEYCLKDADCKGKVRISMPEINYGTNGWIVSFVSKDVTMMDYSFLVNVDPNTGAPSKEGIKEKF